jgi:hypothetical protein
VRVRLEFTEAAAEELGRAVALLSPYILSVYRSGITVVELG